MIDRLQVDDKTESELNAQKRSMELRVRELREIVDGLSAQLSEFQFDFADPEPGFDRSRVKGEVIARSWRCLVRCVCMCVCVC